MIAIRDRNTARIETHVSTAEELLELLRAGHRHWDRCVSSIFFQARHLAASAVSENAETSLVVSALLFRLQPFAKRFLATVIPNYYSFLNTRDQRSIQSDGGFMTVSERMSFGRNRCHHHAMKIASWIDRGVDRCLEIPDMDFFVPFVQQALVS